jgi:hypothetical protein
MAAIFPPLIWPFVYSYFCPLVGFTFTQFLPGRGQGDWLVQICSSRAKSLGGAGTQEQSMGNYMGDGDGG